MDLSETIAPKLDQVSGDDFLAGPRTVTIAEVRKREGDENQRVDVELAEYPGRPFRPCKSMLRVMVAGWGLDSTVYPGRSMTLYRDPSVKYGGEVTGGVRISHMSHIDKPLHVSLKTTRGKRAPFNVQPLADLPPARDWSLEVESAETVEALRALWKHAGANLHARITERVAELQEVTE